MDFTPYLCALPSHNTVPNNIAHIPTAAAAAAAAAAAVQQRSPIMGNGIMPNAVQQKPSSIGRKLPATPVDRSRASALATMAFQNFSERYTKPSTLSLRWASEHGSDFIWRFV